VASQQKTRVLVTGAGGFIGHHLVKYLKDRGYWVRAVDIKAPEYEPTAADEFLLLDLRKADNCLTATRDIQHVYHLAADMGGIGYITAFHADIARNDTMINVHMLEAARVNQVGRFLFSSSACIYPQHLQKDADVTPLKEDDAHPADPEEGYGWEKLYMEKLCQYFRQDYGLETRVVRFHNVYGPLGTYEGGKEKAPAAISRKVALTPDGGEIEIWGDGLQTRSFMCIDDCTEGIYRLMQSNHHDPLNLGTDEMVTVNELVDIICVIAGKELARRHDLTKPQGVRGRNSDNTKLRQVLGWEPGIDLRTGLVDTYNWIEGELRKAGRISKETATLTS
jgi:nucleoside-diphosphate-sugar epimerase